MVHIFSDEKTKKNWQSIVDRYAMNSKQEEMLVLYIKLLLEENQKYNITAITNVDDVLFDHFADSLEILKVYDMRNINSIVDVGTGGGFPGIPLAIMMPYAQICLIEVNLKKVHFLNLVIQKLGLQNVTIKTDDWRTFLRSDFKPVDLVVARASLHVDELLRMFKPSSKLKTSTLIYWASKKWVPTLQEKEYLDTCAEYEVGQKQRRLCFFKNK